jgi:hypothetical protein
MATARRSPRTLADTNMLGAAFKGLLAILALAIGGGIIVCVLYNEMVERLPQYQRPPLVGTFGFAPTMILVGLHWGRQALSYFRRRDV